MPGRGGGCRLCSPANASALCAPPHHAMHDVPCPPAAPTVPGSCHRAHWRSHTSVLQVHRPALVALNGAIIGRQIIPDRQPSSSHCILQPTMQVRRSQNHITPRRISSLTSHRSSSAVSLSLILRCPVIFRNGLNPTASLILHGGLLTHLSAARTSRQCVRQSPRKADTQGRHGGKSPACRTMSASRPSLRSRCSCCARRWRMVCHRRRWGMDPAYGNDSKLRAGISELGLRGRHPAHHAGLAAR